MESQDATGTPAQNANVKSLRTRIVFGVVVILIAVGALWFTGLGSHIRQRATYTPPATTFSGSSESLQQTVIVPTLDSPCPPNKNVIWCSSFQLAWNEMKDKVIGAPVQVTGAEEIAARLNAARPSASDLEPRSYYAAAGRMSEGIAARIHKEMAAKFSTHRLPKFPDLSDGILAYSYLTARVLFRYPFRQIDGEFAFTDSQGAATSAAGFGLWGALAPEYKDVRAQIDILYYRQSEERNRHPEVQDCAVDLCKYSQPYQVVVAMVPPQGSLAGALEYIRTQMAEFEKRDYYYEGAREFHGTDILQVPQMFWRTDHRFRELIGKTAANVGLPILEAMQTIEFRLDRCGAMLESESNLRVGAIPKYLIFNRPFLVYMQKRGAEQPFFVMWVDNAELLTRK